MAEERDLNDIWREAREVVIGLLDRADRQLFDAWEAVKPLVLDGDTFVLGVAPGGMAVASRLTSTARRPLVSQAVSQVIGRPVQLELIEGTEPEAWEREKERRARREQMAEERGRVARQTAGARAVWAELYEQLSKIFGASRERRFATVRAERFVEALRAVREAEQKARAADPDAEDVHEHQLNRNLERIATLADVPVTVVAIEYSRARSAKGE